MVRSALGKWGRCDLSVPFFGAAAGRAPLGLAQGSRALLIFLPVLERAVGGAYPHVAGAHEALLQCDTWPGARSDTSLPLQLSEVA